VLLSLFSQIFFSIIYNNKNLGIWANT